MNWLKKLLQLGLKRKKEPKRLKFFSYAYYNPVHTWDDLEVKLPNGKEKWAAIMMTLEDSQRDSCEHSEHDFDFRKCDNPIKIVPGFVKKQDSDGDYYYSSIYNVKALSSNEYIDTMRQWANAEGYNNFELELKFILQSQNELDEQNKEFEDWVKKGCKPFKIEFAPGFWESMKKMGATDQEIEEIKKKYKEKNKDNGYEDEKDKS